MQRIRSFGRRILAKYRELTSPFRILPDFIIIGARGCGSTTLYNYLKEHPCCIPYNSPLQYLNFFDRNFERGVAWYRSNFPSIIYRGCIRQLNGCSTIITGEESTGYIFQPYVPERVLGTTPNVKIIAVLRNPVDRAYTHYLKNIKRGIERLSFEDAIDSEEGRLVGEDYNSFNKLQYSYLMRGMYLDQLKPWIDIFPKEQMLIIKSEDLLSDNTPRTIKEVLAFLNLSNWEPDEYKKINYDYSSEMNPETRERLVGYFRPHNQRLYDYIGVDFEWE